MSYKELLVKDNADWKEALNTYLSFFKVNLSNYMHIGIEFYEALDIDKTDTLILETLRLDDEFEQSFYSSNYVVDACVDEKTIEIVEKKLSINIPPELKGLYLSHGSFSLYREFDTSDSITIFPIDENAEISNVFRIFGFTILFSQLTDTLTLTELEDIQRRFLFFGRGFIDEGTSRCLLYFYDYELKKFGELCILTDECPKMKNVIFPALFRGELSTFSFDELIRIQVNRLILMKLFSPDYGVLSIYEMEKDRYYDLIESCPLTKHIL
ncbi:SMI1/KNR4 family protein [Proteus mirabilis]|uniref:SMI1/KNR4 family protein n=1 Tax=Proteus mirabilis TaxID=584 RepID=UPI0006671E5F|nr:SMI1/KNR4 family protein [Proteus mirabilis]EKU6443867.1 SMI1/KNR4 family protein [Proteus mirabilis]EKU6781946.1 SMI1/KNR4 family protein [Proteus mirabilis]EKU7265186.1 SMI1/KNR4 family protein [Proteus mirabilis]EKV5078000.1 SMI1/KNR4 family protein [Proteus mirabilis]EKX6520518.1 SMI1/KNR4 family protein [Proteus mirabilis]